MFARRRYWRVLLTTAVAATLFRIPSPGTWAEELQAASDKPRVFRTAAVTRGELVVRVDATGTVEPEELVDVGAEVAGKVASVYADHGSSVDVGALLAKIDDATYVTQCDQAKVGCQRANAVMAEAKAKLGLAKVELQRADDLFKKKSLASSDLEVARYTLEAAQAHLAVAEADVAQSQITLKRAQADLAYTRVCSPVKGVIIDRRVNVGQTISGSLNAPSLFLIAKDLNRLQVWVAVNEADIGRIRKGQPVHFTVDAHPDKDFEGVVSQVRLNAKLIQNEVSYTVVVSVENPKGVLLPYMTANAQFVVDRRKDRLLAPNAALRWRPTWTTKNAVDPAGQERPRHGVVWVRDGESVRPIAVQIGETDGTKTEILDGDVQEGTEVVTGEVFATSDNNRRPAAWPSAAGGLVASVLLGPEDRKAIERTVATMGINQLLVMPGSGASGVQAFGAGTASALTPEDADSIVRECPAVNGAAPIILGRATILHAERMWVTNAVYGTTPSFLTVRGWDELSEGASFTESNVRNASKVCMIGETLRRELFQGESPVGKEIRIQNVAFQIVGVLGRKGANVMGLDQDDIVLAPWTTVRNRLKSPQAASSAASANMPNAPQSVTVDRILCQAASEAEIHQAAEEITELLRRRHHIRTGQDNDFAIRDMTELTKTIMPWKK